MKTDSATRIHHPYSPSKLQPLEACAKYESRFTESEAATTGTMQHDVAESGEDNQNLADFKIMAVIESMKFVDERLSLYPGGKLVKEQYLPIDDEKIQVRGEPLEVLTDPTDPDSDTVLVPTFIDFTGTTAGYLDVGIISADEETGEVIDYKFGKVAVENAGNNLQGYAYLLGLRKVFPKLKKGILWFFMPHRDELTGAEFDLVEQKLVRVYSQDVGWVAAPAHAGGMYLRIKTVVARAVEANRVEDDYSMATPTESSCLFCARLGKCPKVRELALNVGKKYRPLEIPQSVSTTVFSDPADVERGIKFAAVIKQWAESYRTGATNKTIDNPEFCPKGFTLVSTTKRIIKDDRKLGDLAKTFLPEDKHKEVEKLFSVAIGPLEKLISVAAPRGQKEKTVEAFGAKALETGVLEEGQPFAFLRQSN